MQKKTSGSFYKNISLTRLQLIDHAILDTQVHQDNAHFFEFCKPVRILFPSEVGEDHKQSYKWVNAGPIFTR